jgi:predicted AAA+ superfamily ATPase
MTTQLRTLEQFNDWWTTGAVPARLLQPYRRPLFYELLNYRADRQMLLVYGLRRIGKTTIFYQLIQHLLDDGIDPGTILYFSFDVATATIEDVLRTYEQEKLRRNFEDAGRLYIFFDEIHKAGDWQNQLKIFYDLYPNLKIFICGSASINIQQKARESLAGRMFEFLLKPLSFREFLALKGIMVPFDEWQLHERRVFPLFHDYLLKGGFPELINEANEEKITTYLRTTVLERILFIDLPAEFGIKDRELLKTLVELVARNPGLRINYDALARDLKQSKPTIINYVSYLEFGLILKLVHNLRPGFMATSRKLKRAYPSNVAFARIFVTGDDLGRVIETLMVQELDARYYFRDNSAEIDFILKNGTILPIEVKYGKPDPAQFRRALDKTGLEYGLMVTKDRYKAEKLNGKQILMVPAWAFVLFPHEFIAQLSS